MSSGSGGGGGGGGEGLGCLIVAIVVFPFILVGWLLFQLVNYIDEHPEETGEFVRGVAIVTAVILLAPQYAVAWAVLYLCRELVVAHWSFESTDKREQQAILIWLVAIPGVLAVVWFGSVAALAASVMGWGGGIVLALASTTALVGSYYWVYWNRQPAYPQWVLFEAQQQQMWFVMRSEVAYKKLKLKLAWLDFMDEHTGAEDVGGRAA